jgi:hypothetical protein
MSALILMGVIQVSGGLGKQANSPRILRSLCLVGKFCQSRLRDSTHWSAVLTKSSLFQLLSFTFHVMHLSYFYFQFP